MPKPANARRRILSAMCLLPALANPAFAQHVGENAVAQSDDAFGRSVGSERTGLYSSEDVRGFSPLDAGNARIEGLYFDQIDRITQRLQAGSTIRVGISALHYPFPAPTGLVDYQLAVPGEHAQGSLDVEYGEYGGPRVAIEAKVPLDGERLGLALGISGRNQVEAHGGTTRLRNLAGLLQWRPYAGAQVLVFSGLLNGRSEEARATYFPAGDLLPPQIPRRVFLGQPWSGKDFNLRTDGVIAKLPLGDYRLEAGLFQSRRKTFKTFADVLTGVGQDGSAAGRTIIADGNNLDQSLSGEFRLVRDWTSGAFAHSLTLSLRGRRKQRRFGGTQRIALGPSSAIAPDFRPMPIIALGPDDEDLARQLSYGIAYDGEWHGRGSINLGLSRSHYRKSVDFASPLRADLASRDTPLLWNVSGSLIITRLLAIYAGYVTGLEEALIAPEIAANNSEAPPAIRTRQMEAGLRYAVTPKLALVGGVFSVRKPYYNLDPALFYRQLGTVENRGLELSLAGELAKGLAIVAGAVVVDARISGEAVARGLIGKRPVGSSNMRSIANLDWRLAGGKSRWSFDLAYEGRGARVANTANTLSARPRSNFSLGGRYRFELRGAPAVLRVQVQNLFDAYGWAVTTSGGFLYSSPRTATAQLLVDF